MREHLKFPSHRHEVTRIRALVCAAVVLVFAQFGATHAWAQTCEQGKANECHAEGMKLQTANNYSGAFAVFVRGCKAGQKDACAAIPALLGEHPEVRGKGRAVAQLLTTECKAQNDAMCVQLSHDLVDGVGRIRRTKGVRVGVDAACKRNVGAACTARGAMTYRRRNKASQRRARADYKRGCELGDGRGCRRLGELLEATELAQAQSWYAKGCKGNDAISCGNVGRLLVATDVPLAAKLLPRGCDAGDPRSCVSLGRLHQQGNFPGADANVAEQAFRKGCERSKHAESCGQLGGMLHRQGKHAAAEPVLRKACKARRAQACTDLGESLTARNKGRAARRFFGNARRMNQKTCRRGNGAACLSVSKDYAKGRGVRVNAARAGLWLRRACIAGAGERARCLEAGIAAAKPGAGRRVQPILGPMCDKGEVRACMALAPIMPRSQREPIYRRACELGDAIACTKIRGAAPLIAGKRTAELAEQTRLVAEAQQRKVEQARKLAEAEKQKTVQAEQTRKQLEQVRKLAGDEQRKADLVAAAAQHRAELAQKRANQAIAQETAQRIRAEKAEAREKAARATVAQAAAREAAARQEAQAAGEREAAAQKRANEGEAAARKQAKAAAAREALAKRKAEQAGAREARARKRAEQVVAREARKRERADRALASLGATRMKAEKAAAGEAKAKAQAKANAARARTALKIANEQSVARKKAEKREAAQRALAKKQTQARKKAEKREAAQRARADKLAAREAKLKRLAAARETARKAAAQAAAREANARKQAEAQAALAQRQAKEAEQKVAEARRQAKQAAAARAAAVALAAREKSARDRAAVRAAKQQREAEQATAREKAAREKATARELAAREQAKAAAAREAAARKQAKAAAAREAAARKQAEARDEAQRRKAKKVVAREAAARRRAEAAAAREAAARQKAEKIATREAAARKAAEAREAEQRRRAQALAAQAAKAAKKAKAREQKLIIAIKEAKAREAAAQRERADRNKAQKLAAAERKKAQQQKSRQQAAAKRATAQRVAAERTRAAEERRETQAQRKATKQRKAREARESRATRTDQLALACAAQHMASCERAGIRVRDGQGADADPQRALKFFERACEGGSVSACNAGIALLTPKSPAEQKRFRRLHESACESGDASACQRAIGILTESQDESARPLIAGLAIRGCALRADGACVIAGDMAAQGRGIPVDRRQAAESYARVCGSESKSGPGCEGLALLCQKGVLDACERLAGVVPRGRGSKIPVLNKAAKLRQTGDDGDAARLLEPAVANEKTARMKAELGLAYQGTGSFVAAERLLTEALAAKKDKWVTKHRAGLEGALHHAKLRLGWIVLNCTADREEGQVLGAKLPCRRPLRIKTGEHMVELRAPNRRSERLSVTVAASERAEVSTVLEPHKCESPGMLHIGGANGDCCSMGQSWTSGMCSGTAVHATRLAGSDETQDNDGLAMVRVKLLAGVTNFLGTRSTLFRPGVNRDADSAVLGPRVELRVGIHLGSFLTLEGIAGGMRGALTHWTDCESGCVSGFPLTDTMDLGVMLQAHTNPRREGRAVDFHIGVGARPWSRILLENATMGTAKVTSSVIPGELGASLFLGSSVSLDVLAQGELWLPWKYCDSSSGSYQCQTSDAVHLEYAWSALAGLTVHID